MGSGKPEKTDGPTKQKNDVEQSERLIRASRGLPFAAFLGLTFSGIGSLFIESWWPILCYLVPWAIYSAIHYVHQDRFLREAVWCMKIKFTSQLFIFMYSPSLSAWAILIEWYGIQLGVFTSLIYAALTHQYFQVYLEKTQSAWEERRKSNYRFALDPDTHTFRFDQGFNFGAIPGMWWDNLIFGTLFGLTTFSGALIGGLAVDLGVGQPLILTASILMSLLSIRWLIPRELVSIQKIREYEQQHGVTIRPR